MVLPKKLFYTVEAVLYIAYNAQGPVSSRDIAEKQGLPPRYLEQIMQRLVRAGILRGQRGPHGGYVLAKERRRIFVGDIYQVLQEDRDEVTAATSTPLGQKILQPLWDHVEAEALAQLKKLHLADLCEQAAAQNIRKASEERYDFAI